MMNEDEKVKWDEIVRINHDVPAIQAANAELSRLRAIITEYDEMETWLRKNHGYFDYMDEDDSFRFTRESHKQCHFATGEHFLRRIERWRNERTGSNHS